MHTKLLIIILVLQLTKIDAQSSTHRSFLEWKQQHAKNYVDQTEQLYRFYIYNQNLQRINQHNSIADRTYEQGVNQFSDLTWEEFQVTYLTLLPPPNNDVDANRVSSLKQDDPDHPVIYTQVKQEDGDEPEPWIGQGTCTTLVDFSIANATNKYPASVRNQGGCGSCYSFSATSPMTTKLSLLRRRTSRYEFSNQEIVDCNKPQNGGCNGGWFSGVYDYAKIYAISPESTYPYTAKDGTCDTTRRGKGLYKLKSYTRFNSNRSIANLKRNLASNGPLAIALNANSGFSNYRSGALTVAACPASGLNHGVMLVGYNNCDHIKIQNSWGTSWGMRGFIWLDASNNENVCNIYGADTYLPVF